MPSRVIATAVLFAFAGPGMAADQNSAQPSAAGAAATPGLMVQPLPGTSDWERIQARINDPSDTGTAATIAEWRRLSQSSGYSFAEYARFLMANRGWPSESHMRSSAESRIDPNSFDAGMVVRYFELLPPTTPTGHARYAIALSAVGRSDEARAAARKAWVAGPLTAADEAQLLGLYSSAIGQAEHDQRADMLLWLRQGNAASRLLSYVSPQRRGVFEARIAMQARSANAASLAAAAEAQGSTDAGFIGDKAAWLRDTGQSVTARHLLANRPTLVQRPTNAEKWYEILLTIARGAQADAQWSYAYGIASKVDDAYPAGTDVSVRPLGERDDYTSLTWLAGTVALYNLNRPHDARTMFERYATGARSPQTVSKGYYWAGRAALQAGDQAASDRYFSQAGAYPDQFYGQLSLERLGRPIPGPAAVERPVAVAEADRAAFKGRSVVRAAAYLGRQGQYEDQSKFVRAIAAEAMTDQDRALANELASQLSRPDLGVMVGRRARDTGMSGYGVASFPKVPVPAAQASDWTMIHAIARQESQFDRAAISSAGARGLMQLMPGTARDTAGKIGLSYMPGSLTGDPQYNIALGSTYFRQMRDYYGGSFVLAVAAYNAGPGNVNKWLAANGDPRLPGADVLRWIESIPFSETRNYVQRVLENAVVYDLVNPQTPTLAREAKAPLSRYLGKSTPG